MYVHMQMCDTDGFISFSSSAPEGVANLSCLTAGSPNTLEVVWSPPIDHPVLGYLVEVREYVFMENQVSAVFLGEKEILSTRLTVDGLGRYLINCS